MTSGTTHSMRRRASALLVVLFLATALVAPAAGHLGTTTTQATTKPPTSLTGCQTITESGTYELTQDIENSTDATCLNVQASNVTIDGNTHKIAYTGGVLATSPAIQAGTTGDLTNVTVTNLSVRYYGTAVTFDGVTSGQITDITVDKGFETYAPTGTASLGQNGIVLEGGAHHTHVTDNNLYSVGESGDTGRAGNGIYVADSQNATITGNTVYEPPYAGIHLVNASKGNVTANSFNGGSTARIPRAGIRLADGTTNTLVERNDLRGNSPSSQHAQTGITISSIDNHSPHNRLVENDVKNFYREGIAVDGNNTTLVGNYVTGNNEHGIRVYQTQTVTLTSNEVTYNAQGSGVGVALTATDVTLVGNDISHNYADGLTLTDVQTATIRDNAGSSNNPTTGNAHELSLANTTALDIHAYSFRNYELNGTAMDVALGLNDTRPSAPTGYEAFNYLDVTTSGSGYANLTITYQHSEVTDRGLNESTLELWTYNGSWQPIADARLDTTANTLSANHTTATMVAIVGEDDIPPTITAFDATVTNSNLTTRVHTTEQLHALTATITNTTGTVHTLTLGDFSATRRDLAGNHTYANTTQLPAGTYNVTLNTAEDAAGNDGATQQRHETTITPDLSISLSNAALTDATNADGIVTNSEQVTISADATGTVDSVTADASPFGAGTVTLTDGDQDGTYTATITVDAGAAAGNGDHDVNVTASNTQSTTYTHTNTLTLDTTPPTFWFNAIIDATDQDGTVGDGDTIQLNATLYDLQSGITSVTVDASAFGAGTITLTDPDDDAYYTATFTVDSANASADGDHRVSATATNGIGQSSIATSSTLTLTTAGDSAGDTTPPVLANATIIDAEGSPDYTVADGDQITATVTVTDATRGVSSVTLDASGFGAGTVTLTDPNQDDTYNATFTVDAANAQPDSRIAPTVTVTDSAGNSNTTRPAFAITLDTTAPTASLTATQTSIQVGDTVQFNASTSSDPSPGRLTSHAWDFTSDGTTDATGTFGISPTVNHTFQSAGTHTAELTVTDSAGHTDTATITISVAQPTGVGGGSAGYVDVNVSDLPGNGTQETPYEISNASELQAIEDDLTAHYVLTSDIDATGTATWNNGSGFDPLGHNKYDDETSPPFTGSFDGNDHTITGLTIDRPNAHYVGLFGNANATITNLTLRNISVVGKATVGGLSGRLKGATTSAVRVTGTVHGNGSNTGGLVGYNYGGTLTNVSTTVTVTGDNRVGGLAATNIDGQIERATAAGSVNGTDNVGGLIGRNNGGTVLESAAAVDVNGTEWVGGLIGYNQFQDSTVRNASATGDVTGTSSVGGLVGEHDGTIEDAYATGHVSGSVSVGGLTGDVTISEFMGGGTGTVTDAYWDVNASNHSSSAGTATGLTTAEMTGDAAASNMTGLDFQTVWTTQSADYPRLAWLPDSTNPGSSGPDAGDTRYAFSFERAQPGAGSPAAPWNLTKTAGVQNVTAARATHGNQSLFLAGSSGLGQSWATVDLDLTGVATVRGDIYVKHQSNSFGDIKVHVDNTSGKLFGATQRADGQWHTGLEGDASQYEGVHTLILRTRGDANQAYFDNITFYDATGSQIPISELRPANTTPVSFEYTPTAPTTGETITFNVTTPTDRPDSAYAWDFENDGSIDATGPNVTHTFDAGGEYTVQLTITDDTDTNSTTTETLTVTSTAQPGPGLTVPFTERFQDGLHGWAVDARFRTGDRREPGAGDFDQSLFEPGDGGWVSDHNGSVRLHVDGGPSSVGVARNLSNLSAGDRITATFESDTITSQPGNLRLILYPPGDGNMNEIILNVSNSTPITGTVPRDLPDGTQLRVTADVWSGEYTVHITEITTERAPETPSDGGDSRIASFSSTQKLTANQTAPESLAGKLRVESSYANNTTVTLLRSTSTNYSLALTAPGHAQNATFYLQTRAISASQNIENLTMYLDGEEHEYVVNDSLGPGGSPWVAFNVPHFSTRTVTFTSDSDPPTAPSVVAPEDDTYNTSETLTLGAGYNATGVIAPEDLAVTFSNTTAGNQTVVATAAPNNETGTVTVDIPPSDLDGNVTLSISLQNTTSGVTHATDRVNLTATVTTMEAANFTVAIDSTNAPITEGDTLSVTATITNTGHRTSTQTVTLDVDGQTQDSQSVTLDPDNATTITLAWTTTSGAAGDHQATISTMNDTATTSVHVESADSGTSTFDVAIDSTNSPVIEGDTLTVNATITNTGDGAGTQSISLVVNGTEVATSEVSLDAGESRTVTLTWTTTSGDAGDYTATVSSTDTQAQQAVRIQAPGSALEVVDATLASNTTTAAEGVNVTAQISNTGTDPGTMTATLYLNDTPIAQQPVTVDPGNTTTIHFGDVGAGRDPGTYDIRINNQSAGTLTINESTDESTPIDTPGFGLLPPLLALVLISLRRRHQR